MNKNVSYFLLVIGLLVLGILIDCGAERKNFAKEEEPPQIEGIRPFRNAIEIKAEGEVLHYRRESFWNDKQFAKFLETKEDFEAKEIDSFKRTLERYKRYAVNHKIAFDESNKAIVLISDIQGAKERSWFDFDWFLRPYDLDFIDSHFQRKGKELCWEGEAKGVKTTISIKFPYPISNCHEHAWPAR
jgi:hypothetical protein